MKIFLKMDGIVIAKQDGVKVVTDPTEADLVIADSSTWSKIADECSDKPCIVADAIGESAMLKGVGIAPISEKQVSVDTLFVQGFLYNDEDESVNFSVSGKSYTIKSYQLNDDGSISINITTTLKGKTEKRTLKLAIGSFSIAFADKSSSQPIANQSVAKTNPDMTLESIGEFGDLMFEDVSQDTLNGKIKVPEAYNPNLVQEHMQRANGHPQAPLPKGVQPSFNADRPLSEIKSEDDIMDLVAQL